MKKNMKTCFSSDYQDIFFLTKQDCGATENTQCVIYTLKYEFVTNYSRLSPTLKKQYKILRRLIFEEKALREISQKDIAGKISFLFQEDENFDEIKFSMPDHNSSQILKWKINKDEIIPEESLTPWFYQKKNIILRKQAKTACSLSSLIEYRYSDDFGFDIAQKKLPFRKPLTNENRLNNIEKVKDEISRVQKKDIDPLDMTLKELIEVNNPKDTPDDRDDTFNKKLKELFEANPKEFDDFLWDFFNISNYIPDMRIKNLIDISKDSPCMDFSDFIKRNKTDHYRKCIEYIHGYYAKREIVQKLLSKKSYGTWHNLKKDVNSSLLYIVLSEIKNNTSLLATNEADLLKKRLQKIDKDLKSDLSNLDNLFKPNIAARIRYQNETRDTNTFLKLKDKIEKYIPHKILKNENFELLKKIETFCPYLEQDFLLSDLQSKKYCTGHLRVEHEKNSVQTVSINRVYNLLTKHRGADYSCKDQNYTSKGDIIVSSANNSLGCWAIVDEDNIGRPVGDGTYILGNAKDNIRLWSLLRSKYIQEQISACADVNISNMCYKTLFANVFINNDKPEYDNINQLSFEVASILNRKTIALNPFPLRYFANKLKELIKLNFSMKHIDFYVLMQKLEVFIRNSSYKPHNECLIVYDNHSLDSLMPQKKDTDKTTDSKTSESNRKDTGKKKLARIFRVPAVEQKLCNVNTEKKEQLLKAVSNSDVCIIFLSFDDINKIDLAKKILQIMGNNHIFAKLSNTNTIIRHEEIPNTLAANFGNVNYCHITEYPGFYMTENIRQLIHQGNYLETIFKDFLIGLSACSRESFKRVDCRGKSKATKIYTAKEIFPFETLKKDLIHLAYNFKSTNSFMPYYTLLILGDLNNIFRAKPFAKNDDIWEKFKYKYKPLIRERKIDKFISKHASLIENNKIAMPILFKIANKDNESLITEKNNEIKQTLECLPTANLKSSIGSDWHKKE